MHIQSYSTAHLPRLHLEDEQYNYVCQADLIDETCDHILQRAAVDTNIVISLVIRCDVQADGQGGVWHTYCIINTKLRNLAEIANKHAGWTEISEKDSASDIGGEKNTHLILC